MIHAAANQYIEFDPSWMDEAGMFSRVPYDSLRALFPGLHELVGYHRHDTHVLTPDVASGFTKDLKPFTIDLERNETTHGLYNIYRARVSKARLEFVDTRGKVAKRFIRVEDAEGNMRWSCVGQLDWVRPSVPEDLNPLYLIDCWENVLPILYNRFHAVHNSDLGAEKSTVQFHWFFALKGTSLADHSVKEWLKDDANRFRRSSEDVLRRRVDIVQNQHTMTADEIVAHLQFFSQEFDSK